MPLAFIRVKSFSELEQDFITRAHGAVWCNVATVNAQGRPRSRILHPIWEGSTGWITTRRTSPKARELAGNPYVSLAYIADVAKPTYAECEAEWIEDLTEKQRIWDLLAQTPPPLGFDPAPIYKSVDHPDAGLLRLTPWRIELMSPTERRVWQV